MKNVLVTGGLGFIGAFVVKQLLSKGVDKVVIVDTFASFINPLDDNSPRDGRKARLKFFDDRVVIERSDTNNSIVMARLLARHKPDSVIHLAALPLAKIPNINAHEALNGSVSSTTNLIEIMADLKKAQNYEIKKFVYISSSMVYGHFPDFPPDESVIADPIEPYGIMKLAGEQVTKGLCSFYEIPFCIIRPSAVYGPTDSNRRVSQIFIEKAMTGQPITVSGESEQLDFTYVEDLAVGIVEAAQNEAANGEIFNLTSGDAVTLLDFAKAAIKYAGKTEINIKQRDPFRPRRGTLNIEKARNILQFKPKNTLEEGIRKTVHFMKSGIL